MGAEAIIEKIRKNAAEEAASIRKQGEDRAAAAAKQITDAASAEAEEILRSAKASAADVERRERLMAGLETRKNTLASRREVLDKAFSQALDQLAALPEDRWAALIQHMGDQLHVHLCLSAACDPVKEPRPGLPRIHGGLHRSRSPFLILVEDHRSRSRSISLHRVPAFFLGPDL